MVLRNLGFFTTVLAWFTPEPSPPTASFAWNAYCNVSSTARTTSTDCCNGVQGLCDLQVDDILFATVHNAHATEDDGWIIAANNKFSLEKALLAGYRGINVDVGTCNGELKLIHGLCAIGSRKPLDVWTNIAAFLVDNPRDVLIVTVEIVKNEKEKLVTLDALRGTMPQEFSDLLYVHDPTSKEFPTLQELIDLDRRILFFFVNGPSCSKETCPPGFNEWFRYAIENSFSIPTANDVICDTTSQRGSNGLGVFYLVNNYISNPLPNARASAQVNTLSFVSSLIDECSSTEDRDVNLIMVDFWDKGDVIEVTQRHNHNLVQQHQRHRNVHIP